MLSAASKASKMFSCRPTSSEGVCHPNRNSDVLCQRRPVTLMFLSLSAWLVQEGTDDALLELNVDSAFGQVTKHLSQELLSQQCIIEWVIGSLYIPTSSYFSSSSGLMPFLITDASLIMADERSTPLFCIIRTPSGESLVVSSVGL